MLHSIYRTYLGKYHNKAYAVGGVVVTSSTMSGVMLLHVRIQLQATSCLNEGHR